MAGAQSSISATQGGTATQRTTTRPERTTHATPLAISRRERAS